MKKCSKCKVEKSESGFYKDRSKRDRLKSQCKTCVKDHDKAHAIEIAEYQKGYYQENRAGIAEQKKDYRQENKTEIAEKKKDYYDTLEGYLRHTFGRMVYRCMNSKAHNYSRYGGRGIKVLFTSDAFVDYVMSVLQVDPRGLTIDRIDNDGHYEKGNIRFVSQAVNNRNKDRKELLLV